MTEAPHERFGWRSFSEVLAARAAELHDGWSFSFLNEDEEESSLTFGELDRRARAIGAMLQTAGAAGERALLLFPPGIDYLCALFACLRGGIVAVPAYHPARLNRTLPRLTAMIEDARPMVVLTNAQTRAAAEKLFDQAPVLRSTRWIVTGAEAPGEEDAFREPDLRRDSLALLQYTSGSTSAPRGVMLSHGNLLHNSGFICRQFGHHAASRGVIWLPPYHDMGLIGGILQPVYAGFPCTLMSPAAFVTRPQRWLRAVTKYRGTTSGGPNFAYDHCLKRITPEQCEGLDLSSWDLAFNGAEPIRPDTLERFARFFAPWGFRAESFYPCYGLAEGTLAVTGGRKGTVFNAPRFENKSIQEGRAHVAEDGSGNRLVNCGYPADDQEVRIVDPIVSREVAAGRVGEIWVHGPSVAQGYWNRPQENTHAFGGRLTGHDGTFLRTGDLGFLHEGNLYVTGRLKDVLIVRGRNYYPHDIERASWESHTALRPFSAAAFTVVIGDTDRLVVVQEVDSDAAGDPGDMLLAIRRGVADAVDLQVHTIVLVGPRGVPLTPSGKVQRSACKRLFLDQELEAVTHWSLAADAPAEDACSR
ncbi:MAG TPA: fatty acyl-AMP ligase [Thermoanaerobaculia bacterium]|nr:fatty acyl-AMP ligase [Thermoanaerobaculia bacterium]